jgi:hydroxyethylthiazole kinase-like uncharacterized protein yjeF
MIELLTPEEMGRADRLTIDGGVPGTVLMESAGHAVADVVAGRHPLGVRVGLLAGPGNNGGDAYVAARVLAQRGYAVAVLAFGDPQKLAGDARAAFDAYRGTVGAADAAAIAGGRFDIIVDGLFGAGRSRPREGRAADLVAAVTRAAPRWSRSTFRAGCRARPAPSSAPPSRPTAPSPSSAASPATCSIRAARCAAR